MEKPLDIVITAFASQEHPLVIIGLHALRWMGVRDIPSWNALHLLISDSTGPAIVSTLLSSQAWRLSHEKPDLGYLTPAEVSAVTRLTTIDDLWELTLFPERVYGLRTDGPLIQVPDFSPLNPVLIEEEMDPGPIDGPAPVFLSHKTRRFIFSKSDLPGTPLVQATLQREVEIFIPTVVAMLEALCGQAPGQPEHFYGGEPPERLIGLLIRDLYLDRERQRRKLEERLGKNANWEYLKKSLDKFKRTEKGKWIRVAFERFACTVE